jgi:hypothetical protein
VRREREDYEDAVGLEARRFRVSNLLRPAIGLLPSCAGFAVAATRRQAAALRADATRVYPEGYEPAVPTFHHPSDCLEAAQQGSDVAVLRAPASALDAVDRWLAPRRGARRLVTVTLRYYSYMPARNSRLADWAKFARDLDPAEYFVVVVPDTDQTLDPLPSELDGLEVFSEAAWTLQIRMALYERAFLNLGVNNGPMGLCWLNRTTRYITLRMLTDGVPQTTIDFNMSFGFEPDRNLPFATPFQKWLWREPDTAEVVRREFDLMVQSIAGAAPGATERPRIRARL